MPQIWEIDGDEGDRRVDEMMRQWRGETKGVRQRRGSDPEVRRKDVIPRNDDYDNTFEQRQPQPQLALPRHPTTYQDTEIEQEDVLANRAIRKIELAKKQGLEDVKLMKIEWEALQRKTQLSALVPDVDSRRPSPVPSPKLLPAFSPSPRPSPLPSPSLQITSASVHTFPFRSSSPVRPSLSPISSAPSSAPSSFRHSPLSAHSRPRLDFPALVRTSTDPLNLPPVFTQNRTPSPTRVKEVELVDMPRGYSSDSVRERRKRWENQSSPTR